MKEKRELKPSLQKLVHKLNDLGKELRKVYPTHKKEADDKALKNVYALYEEGFEVANTLVLEYMANVRKSDDIQKGRL